MLRRWLIGLAAILILYGCWPTLAHAQQAPVDADATAVQTFDPQQLDALLAPVALYPDQLVTQLLMATTFPLEVVDAARWIEDPAHKNLKGDALTKALEPLTWDPSVKSLVPFPQVLAQMNANLDWMQQLGYAFASQQQAVFDSIQRLRRQAQSSGHLQSSPQQVVQATPAPDGQQTISIDPAQPDTVYVPSYDPTLVYGAWPYAAYPPVVLPPPPGYVFGTALATGLAFGAGVAITAGLWGWASPNWGRGDVNVNVNRWNSINGNRTHINSNVWRASARPGGLPPNLRRPPAGPVGRPARGNGLPAGAIGRSNVSVPGNLVNRPASPNHDKIGQGNRPNLAPGSRPSPGNRPGGTHPNQGQRPNINPGNRPGGNPASHVNRPSAPRPPAAQRPQNGAFAGMGQGDSATQFAQRGGQSRQFGGGGGGFARGGGGRAGGFHGGGGGRGRR